MYTVTTQRHCIFYRRNERKEMGKDGKGKDMGGIRIGTNGTLHGVFMMDVKEGANKKHAASLPSAQPHACLGHLAWHRKAWSLFRQAFLGARYPFCLLRSRDGMAWDGRSEG